MQEKATVFAEDETIDEFEKIAYDLIKYMEKVNVEIIIMKHHFMLLQDTLVIA